MTRTSPRAGPVSVGRASALSLALIALLATLLATPSAAGAASVAPRTPSPGRSRKPARRAPGNSSRSPPSG